MQTRLEAPGVEPPAFLGAAVELDGVTRRFAALTALDSLDLHVAPSEIVALVGASGCGKSTLLELVAGLQDPDAGAVRVLGAAGARDRLASCAYMPQRDLLLPWRDSLGNAALALECAGVPRAEARDRARPLLRRFGLDQFERARPGELSGGMRQRVAFMRTLLAGRPVLALDEPFAALDSLTRADMQEWLAAALSDEPRTVLLVTHDVEEAVYLADRVCVLSPRPGRVVAELEVPFPRPRPRPRREIVAEPEFAELRARALEALA